MWTAEDERKAQAEAAAENLRERGPWRDDCEPADAVQWEWDHGE